MTNPPQRAQINVDEAKRLLDALARDLRKSPGESAGICLNSGVFSDWDSRRPASADRSLPDYQLLCVGINSNNRNPIAMAQYPRRQVLGL